MAAAGAHVIVLGDIRDTLPAIGPLAKQLAAELVQCVVTSPPYFGLRDYGVEGQIGLESVPDCLGWATGNECGACFVCTLVTVFRGVRRVLRDDGTCWVNLGDSYAGSWGAQGRPQGQGQMQGRSVVSARQIGAHPRFAGLTGTRGKESGMKPKDLMGMPWRVALALQADGWYLRQEIIWHKPNPMPESTKDRCTKAHEHLFLLTKSRRYYWNFEAMQEPMAAASIERLSQPNLEHQRGSDRVPGKTNGPIKAVQAKGNRKTFRGGGAYTQGQSFDNSVATQNDSVGNEPNAAGTRNKRSVWTVATEPFKEAHFATYPQALVEPCILAGTRPGDLVLDPFLGSGTTAIVAERLGRRWVGCELNAQYAEIAGKRIKSTQPGLPL